MELQYFHVGCPAYAGLHPLVKKGETMFVSNNHFLWNWLLDTKIFVGWINDPKALEASLNAPNILLPDLVLLEKESVKEFPDYAEHLDWWKDSFLPGRYTNVYTDDYCELYRINNRTGD